MEAFRSSSNTLSFFFLLLFSSVISCADAEVHYHEFVDLPPNSQVQVHSMPVRRLCRSRNVITVNGQFPGPTLEARNGDTLIVYVINRAKYNVTIHWHGVRQLRTAWADGPEFVTQCPIAPGGSYRYWFTVENQEGTLWWHAHSSWLRASVHGALIIYPAHGSSYPFQRPDREFPVILGEWWNKDPIRVIRRAIRTGAAPNVSDAFTINGQPGDLYNCSSDETTMIPVAAGETNLLRFINAAVNHELFIMVAGHSMTVVAADAEYTAPFTTSLLMLGPGQTTDVLLVADQPAGRYYLAARAFISSQGVDFDNTTTTAILEYDELRSSCPADADLAPALPDLPEFNDTAAADAFTAGIRSPAAVDLPGPVDHDLFVTVGLGLLDCRHGRNCSGPNGTRLTASMNNVSFDLPSSGLSMLQAHRLRVPGVFTADFPAAPPVEFDYISTNVSRELMAPEMGTKVYPLEFGSVVQVVMQGTGIVTVEEHPMHVHGYHFYVLATGTGNFDPGSDPSRFNLVDPPLRNTVGVPAGGWAVIRFAADNPGMWLVHCHLDVHISWGLAMAFLVEDGAGTLQSLEPPPPDLPPC